MSRWIRTGMLVFVVALLIAGGFLIGTAVVSSNASPVFRPLTAEVAQQAQPLTDYERLFADVYNHVSPSVVSINVVARTGFQDEFTAGTGTGFVIDQQGHIITNNHVVMGANRIEVNFYDGTITRADVVGLDPDSDIAVIQVDLPAEKLVPVQFADSDQLFIGQMTVAIGSPFNQRWTMTTGIISALGRTIEGLSNFQTGGVIQTDAAINPGNSGGPLLDLQGRVIGVNSQIISRTRSNAGIGFAVPSNLVQRVASELIIKGRVNYSYLGISSRSNDVDLALIEGMRLPNDTRGVVVQAVEPGGPAALAGLRNAANPVVVDGITVPSSADIITAIDGHPLTGFDTLIAYLATKTQPGQTVNLTVLRDGQLYQMPLTLGERPQQR